MKKSILNLKGFTVLSKSQKKEVAGGRLDCSTPTGDQVQMCCCYGINCTITILKSICPFI